MPFLELRKISTLEFALCVAGACLCLLSYLGWGFWSALDPARMSIPSSVALPLGVTFTALGFGLFGYSELRKGGVGREEELVTTGLYSRIRHPMYMGIILFHVGYPLIFRSFAALVSTVLWAAALYSGRRHRKMSADTHNGFTDTRVYGVEYPTFTRGLNGDIIVLRDDTLLYGFTAAGCTHHGLLCCRSTDDGRTWSEPQTLLPALDLRYSSPGDEWIAHPSFLRRANGQILMAYIWAVGSGDPWGHTYFRFSDDECQTWSDPKVLTASHRRIAIVHNAKLLRISGGRILAPAEIRIDMGRENDHRGFVAAVWYSDDDGHSWYRSENTVDMLAAGIEAQEAHLVELRDGRIMMMFRTYSGHVGRAYSADRGETWSAGELLKQLPLPTQSSALHVTRMPASGDLLLVRSTGDGTTKSGERPKVRNRVDGREHFVRTPFTATVSRDEGASWENERIIAGDPCGDYGYPSVLHGDGFTIVSYHSLDGLHVARIPTGWFYET